MDKRRRFAGWRGQMEWAIWEAGRGWVARVRECDEQGDVCWYEQVDCAGMEQARAFVNAMAEVNAAIAAEGSAQ